MPNRYFLELKGSAATAVTLPTYTGLLTFDVFPIGTGAVAGLPDGTPTVVGNQWSTVTVNVANLTEIGRGFVGLLANIVGAGLDVPLALASGVEAPAGLTGTVFEQYECEPLGPLGDWVRVQNLFLPQTLIIETAQANGFFWQNNNLTVGRQYYISSKFTPIDAMGNELDVDIPIGIVKHKIGQYTCEQKESGEHNLGPEFIPPPMTVGSHYVQLITSRALRLKLVARVSQVFKQARSSFDYLHLFVIGQSLSNGSFSGPSDLQQRQPVRDSYTHLAYGSKRSSVRGGFAQNYEGLKPWVESRNVATHVHSTLMQFDAQGMPDNLLTLTVNEGVAGQTIQQAASYAPEYARTALNQFSSFGLNVSDEYAFVLMTHGESNALTFSDYDTQLLNIHNDYDAKIKAARPNVQYVEMVLDQTGGNAAYFNVAVKSWEYARSRASVHLACPKYAINFNFAASATDTIHLNKIGYKLQGDYIGRALSHRFKKGRKWRPFEPDVVYPGVGNTLIVECHVPVLPIVLDAGTVPQAPANGVLYRRVNGTTVVPVGVAVQGANIVVDIGEAPQIGATLEFGHNDINSFAITNFRDSDTTVGASTGLFLQNWMVLSALPVVNKPIRQELTVISDIAITFDAENPSITFAVQLQPVAADLTVNVGGVYLFDDDVFYATRVVSVRG